MRMAARQQGCPHARQTPLGVLMSLNKPSLYKEVKHRQSIHAVVHAVRCWGSGGGVGLTPYLVSALLARRAGSGIPPPLPLVQCSTYLLHALLLLVCAWLLQRASCSSCCPAGCGSLSRCQPCCQCCSRRQHGCIRQCHLWCTSTGGLSSLSCWWEPATNSAWLSSVRQQRAALSRAHQCTACQQLKQKREVNPVSQSAMRPHAACI